MLSIGPKLDVAGDRLYGRTPPVTRVLWLFSYDRHVTIDRRQRYIVIETRRFWAWRRRLMISFDRISRIVVRAQELPAFGLWGFLTLGLWPSASSAFVLVGLELDDGDDEFSLFTVWLADERGMRWPGLPMASSRGDGDIGDESVSSVITLLQTYLGVPVSTH